MPGVRVFQNFKDFGSVSKSNIKKSKFKHQRSKINKKSKYFLELSDISVKLCSRFLSHILVIRTSFMHECFTSIKYIAKNDKMTMTMTMAISNEQYRKLAIQKVSNIES